MVNSSLVNSQDMQAVREMIQKWDPRSSFGDFEEQILLPGVRETLRVWRRGSRLVGLAYVDDYNNLWFNADPGDPAVEAVEAEMIAWGESCVQKRSRGIADFSSLDCSCSAAQTRRTSLLLEHGFELQPMRSMQYSRLLTMPITLFLLPAGFTIRSVNGIEEVSRLVALHRAAFGTDQMTVEQRLAMMHVPQYRRDLDLVVVEQNQELVAFCVCGLEGADNKIGYTDPIGTHPRYQRLGLGKAILSAGLVMLKNLGAEVAELGTSSENIAMQKLAGASGFVCVSEKLWFSKEVQPG